MPPRHTRASQKHPATAFTGISHWQGHFASKRDAPATRLEHEILHLCNVTVIQSLTTQSSITELMPATILTVDDERDVTDLLYFHLAHAGYRVVSAATGREALAVVAAQHPDLIVLDLMLPDIDGFGVCEMLRRQPATATLPIIILSAWATTESRHLGLELGALDYMTKPFSPKELVRRVSQLLDLRPAAPKLGA